MDSAWFVFMFSNQLMIICLAYNACLAAVHGCQGKLAGAGGDDLPTIVLVAHYDSFGVAPVRINVILC